MCDVIGMEPSKIYVLKDACSCLPKDKLQKDQKKEEVCKDPIENQKKLILEELMEKVPNTYNHLTDPHLNAIPSLIKL